jgi:hypothetical protein
MSLSKEITALQPGALAVIPHSPPALPPEANGHCIKNKKIHKLATLIARPICKLLHNSTSVILVGKCVIPPVVVHFFVTPIRIFYLSERTSSLSIF